MNRELLVVGGGIGGLALALAADRAGWSSRLFEQAPAFTEVGAGVQLGPNATRVLRAWGLLEAVSQRACVPQRLVARDALDGRELASLALGRVFNQRYGAPYLTVHRADLHAVLLAAARARGARLHAGARLESVADTGSSVFGYADGQHHAGDVLVGADGLWSQVRQHLLDDGPPRPSEHVAYRALVPIDALDTAWRVPQVHAWLGPRLHAVAYPVRGGEAINLVCVVHQAVQGDPRGWDLPGAADALLAALGPVCPQLQGVVQAVPSWGRWVLHDRAPVGDARQMARGRIALLGDAAHPMRPYLAQGASMALEDALELGQALATVTRNGSDIPAALQRYARTRWPRVARVQRRSLRNAVIFHATGPLRLARDTALRALGPRLMDLPWLYRG